MFKFIMVYLEKYILHRANELHVKYLNLFYPELKDLHICILLYVLDEVYEGRRTKLMKELRNPSEMLVYLTTIENKFQYAIYHRLLVIRYIDWLIDIEFSSERIVRYHIVRKIISSPFCKVIRFHHASIFLDDIEIYFNVFTWEEFDFNKIILGLRRRN